MGKKRGSRIHAAWTGLVFLVLILCWTMGALGSYREQAGKERTAEMEETIRQYAVQCYALEGAYPPDLAHLAKEYGLVLDEDRYFYYYSAFASNILPEVIVIEKGERRPPWGEN
ncbi:hypothetical protein [Anaerotalea alkaliphila]|uniref:Type II secretion system protein n=1 Tax=Anaerotalea alkaliphila TaxID=2662126 RepID=A0A7X5HT27_9FIRM|nr:hypothetical protein [Anaerotalea alkaliphila]NDL66170.1 hypothetical protein [Anaerotalea alkaliphila]